jgi:DNA-binding CsgD family transcriptional regulator
MNFTFFNYEWEFLIQFVNRIHCCTSYTDLCQTLLQQLPTTISFQAGAFFRTDRKDGHGIVSSYQSTCELDLADFMNGEGPCWSEFIMYPNSTVFRQSDLISCDKWERSQVYKKYWAPNNGYWGLMSCIVYHDHPLVLFGIYREKDKGDFTERDVYVMNLLRPALEVKFYSLLVTQSDLPDSDSILKISQIANQYNLTRQEIKIMRLICSHQSNSEICDQLFIAPATLNKHISNIYKKTNSDNRVQLINLFYT